MPQTHQVEKARAQLENLQDENRVLRTKLERPRDENRRLRAALAEQVTRTIAHCRPHGPHGHSLGPAPNGWGHR